MEIEDYIGCLFCGIKRDKALYPNCRTEMARFDILLISHWDYAKEHHWVKIKSVSNWYEKGAL